MNNPMKGIMKKKLEKKRPNMFGIVISNICFGAIYIYIIMCTKKIIVKPWALNCEI